MTKDKDKKKDKQGRTLKATKDHEGYERRPVKTLVRKSSVSREKNTIIDVDPDYKLRVASKPGGAVGKYSLKDGSGTIFTVRRLSDYDDKVFDDTVQKLSAAVRIGRRPGEAKSFEKYDDIVKALIVKNENWIDKKSPMQQTDYQKEHHIPYKFEMTRPEEVFPDKKVINLYLEF